MKSYLYIFRHGETELNLAQRNQGQCDSPLTAKGIEQVLSVGRYLKEHDIRIDRVYASPLGRAIQSAELISKDYVIDEGLIERSFGELEGVSWFDERNCVDARLESYGGESNETLMKRIVPAYRKVMDENPGKTILMVGHAGAIRQFCEYWKGNDRICFARKEIPNGTLFRFEYRDGEFYLDDLIYTSNG